MTKEKEPKKFMESNALHHKQHKLKTRHHLGEDKRVHYGSGFMSDYHSSIKKARTRLTNREKLHPAKGGSINETRVY